MNIAHIVNPVKVSPSSDLFLAQPITFQSMIKAKQCSAEAERIGLFAICYEEDYEIVPKEFVLLPQLTKSVFDYGTFQGDRRLPLLRDILNPLIEYREYEYVVYTNVDIALMPYFYDYVFSSIRQGCDSLVINRRVIKHEADYPIMYAELGKSHPGADCFVFRRELIERFNLGEICVGANWIGRVLIANLTVLSEKVEVIKDAHLTFHIGDDGTWLTGRFSEFDLHNKRIAYSIIESLMEAPENESHRQALLREKEKMDRWDDVRLEQKMSGAGAGFLSRIVRKIRILLK